MSATLPRELHAEDFRILETREEISLFFGAVRQESSSAEQIVIDTATRIVLTPSAAKRLSRLLKASVVQYESANGIIGSSLAAQRGVKPPAGKDPLSRRKDTLRPAARLRHLVDALGVAYGLEHSFKIFPGTLLDDRYLIAIHREALPASTGEKLLALCRDINMPRRFQNIFLEHLSESNIVLFGYEGNETGGTYKAYLEFGDMFNTGMQEYPAVAPSFLIHLGMKWDVKDNRRGGLARYTCYPTLTVEETLNRISERFYARRESASFEIVRGIMNRAALEIPSDDFLYVEVKEENNPRQSYDINMYRANLTMEDLYPWLREACRIQGVGLDVFHGVYEPMKKTVFGHISGGVDRKGRDFFTFYYGVAGSTR